jgi:hypothetical protein
MLHRFIFCSQRRKEKSFVGLFFARKDAKAQRKNPFAPLRDIHFTPTQNPEKKPPLRLCVFA